MKSSILGTIDNFCLANQKGRILNDRRKTPFLDRFIYLLMDTSSFRSVYGAIGLIANRRPALRP